MPARPAAPPANRSALLATIAALGLASCRASNEDPRVQIERLEDRRVAVHEEWDDLLSRGDAEVRLRAARAVGRLRDPALSSSIARALHIERSDEVKAEQLFALGQLADGESLGVLLDYLADDSPELRAVAAEAIGKLAVPQAAPNLVAHLLDPAPAARGATLLALARLVGRRSPTKGALDRDAQLVFLQTVPSLLEDPDDAVRWKAAYALSEVEIDGRLELLLAAARSNDARARFFAAGGLARLGGHDPRLLAAFLAALEDPDRYVAAAGAIGLGKLKDAAADKVLFERSELPGSVSIHVRKALLSAAVDRARTWPKELPADKAEQTTWKWGRQIFTDCTKQSGDPSALVRGEALRGVVLLGESTMHWLPEKLRGEPRPLERVLYVRALGAASFDEVGATLCDSARDRDPYVASEALTALAGMAPATGAADDKATAAREQLAKVAREAAASNDLAVAGSALDLLKAVGSKEDLRIVTAAYARLGGFQDAEARATAVHCAASLGGRDSVELLRRAREDESPAVAAAAREEWKRLGIADDAAVGGTRASKGGSDGSTPSSVELEPGVDFLSKAPNPRIALHFAKGDVTIELLREDAPHHVKMMVGRVIDGRCDGLPIHRVVSGFVVQGLDPRGDGWGSGGVFLRDEINRVPYERGAVGMPNAGPDSGGCQIFVTLEPTPHLDGRYTVFGRVVSGMDVVDALDLGDPCVRAEVLR